MGRSRFSPKTRQSGVIDPKLIIIATEGKCTEKQYFEELRRQRGKTNVHVELLETLDGNSSPLHVLARLDAFAAKYSFKSQRDQLWMVIDTDKWGIPKIAQVSQLCTQKGYRLAVSNPSFELWLLLHHKRLQDYSQEEKVNISLNEKTGTRTYIETLLISINGSYNKSKINPDHFFPYIEHAIAEAKSLDNPNSRWPDEIGTKVFLLVEEIITPLYTIS